MRPSARRILTPGGLHTPVDLRTQKPWPRCPRCSGRAMDTDGRRCSKCKGMGLLRPRNWDSLRVAFGVALLFALFAYAVRCSP